MSTEPTALAPRALVQAQIRKEATGRVLQIFLNHDLRNGHDGLSGIAKEAGIDTRKLVPGQYVAFINAKKDKLKLYAANGVVAYLKLEAGRKIDERVIRELPRVFQGGRIDYDKALKEVVETALARKRIPVGQAGHA